MPALVAGIHVFRAASKTWMAGTSPAMTWKDRVQSKLLVARVALLGPRIAAVVIAVDLPESGMVLWRQLDARQPLGALPEVKVRDDEAHWAAVLAGERRALPAMRQDGVLRGKVLERHVGGVA